MLQDAPATSTVLVNLCDDFEVRRDMFGINIWQLGNRLGVTKDKNFKKWNSGHYIANIASLDGKLSKRFTGGMAHMYWTD